MRERARWSAGSCRLTRVRAKEPRFGSRCPWTATMTVPLKTRILLADDHAVVRDGLRMVLDSAPDLEVVAQAGDGAEAVELALAEEIDLAVSMSRCRA